MKKIIFFAVLLLMFVSFSESAFAMKCVAHSCNTTILYTFDEGRNCENDTDYVCCVYVKRTICGGTTCTPGISNWIPGTCRIFAGSSTVVYSESCGSENEVSTRWWFIETIPGKPYCDYTRCFFCPEGGRPEAVWESQPCPNG